MPGCSILKKLEEAMDDAAQLKEIKAQLQLDLRHKFEECKTVCKCDGERTMADLKQCPVCFSVTKLGYSKKACLKRDGLKRVMIRVNK